MKVDQLIKELQLLSDAGCGNHDVCYMYYEYIIPHEADLEPVYEPVHDSIKNVCIADPADGEEVHLFQ